MKSLRELVPFGNAGGNTYQAGTGGGFGGATGGMTPEFMDNVAKFEVKVDVDITEAKARGLKLVYAKWLDDKKPTVDNAEVG